MAGESLTARQHDQQAPACPRGPRRDLRAAERQGGCRYHHRAQAVGLRQRDPLRDRTRRDAVQPPRSAELDTAEEALVYASNAALVANRVSLNEANDVREQLTDARATLSLGLEVLSSGDAQKAAAVTIRARCLPMRRLM